LTIVASPLVVQVAVLVNIEGRWIALIIVFYKSLRVDGLMLLLEMLTGFKSIVLGSQSVFISLSSVGNVQIENFIVQI
jgi:hypothetical protein